MRNYQSLFVLTFLLFNHLSTIKAQSNGDLKIVVKNFKSISGQVKIGLYNSEENYMTDSFMYSSQEVNDLEVVFFFKNVPYGQYTFSLYHDANANDQLDKNALGIPKEDYAFSNNANGRFGPPSYNESVFEINAPIITQSININ